MSHNIVTVKGPNPQCVKICRKIPFPYLFADVVHSVTMHVDLEEGKIVFKIRKIH